MSNDRTSAPASWFAGLGGASQGGGGNFIAGGDYLMTLRVLTRRPSQDPKKKGARLVIAELVVDEVLAAFPKDGDHPASNGKGENVSVVINLDGAYPDMELGKLKGILEAALGHGCATTDEEWAALAERSTTPPGTDLAGTKIRVTATRIRSRAGKPIAALRFSSVE